jgi:hypothetical protein
VKPLHLFLIAFVALLLSGCALLFGENTTLSGTREGDVVTFKVYQGPSVSASSTQAITAFTPKGPCVFQASSADTANDKFSVKCDVAISEPGGFFEVKLTTKGTVSAIVYDGLRPVGRNVVVPKSP